MIIINFDIFSNMKKYDFLAISISFGIMGYMHAEFFLAYFLVSWKYHKLDFFKCFYKKKLSGVKSGDRGRQQIILPIQFNDWKMFC